MMVTDSGLYITADAVLDEDEPIPVGDWPVGARGLYIPPPPFQGGRWT